MNVKYLFFCILLLSSFSHSSVNYGVLDNNNYSVSIELNPSSRDFGSIVSFSDNNNDVKLRETWFSINPRNLEPRSRDVLVNSDSIVKVRLSDYPKMPLEVEVSYKRMPTHVQVDIKAWVKSEYTFIHGLPVSINTSASHVKTGAIGAEKEFMDLNSNTRDVSSYCKPVTTFTYQNNDVTFLIRNPFHSAWRFSGKDNRHHLDLLHSIKPIEEFIEGLHYPPSPPIGSTFGTTDTLYRRIEVHPNSPEHINTLVTFNEHKDGKSQAITMYWDELPNRDNWNYMTTRDALDVRHDHFWVRLMEEHPNLKMGYLLMMNRMLFRPKSSFEHWTVDSPFIIGDTLERYDGQWSMLLYLEQEETIRAYQDITCEPNTEYEFGYYLKTENITGYGAYGEVYTYPDFNLISVGERIESSSEWTYYRYRFKTGPKDTTLRVFLRIQEGKGRAFFDSVYLRDKRTGENLIRNGGFENNVTQVLYTDERRHWSDARGVEHVVTFAPPEYIDFLQRIENNTLKYGWEDRVHLGSHGYQHTPALSRPDIPFPGWEFQHFDPHGDSLRIARIINETKDIGLTKKSLRFFRAGGNRWTASLVNKLIKHDVVFLDPMKRDDYTSYFVQKDGKRLWMVSLCWWADLVPNEEPLDEFTRVLETGHLAHIGGHPEAVLADANLDSYKRLSNIFRRYEEKFPNLGYVFPDEYADNANSIYEINDINVEYGNNNLAMYFTGKTMSGNSIVVDGTFDTALFNGQEVEIVQTGVTSYVVLPEAPYGNHSVYLKNYQANNVVRENVSNNRNRLINQVFVFGNQLNIESIKEMDVNFAVYNLQGRKLVNKNINLRAGINSIPLDSFIRANGKYIYTIRSKEPGNKHTVSSTFMFMN
ncbi:hypothetical protein CHISP_0293 [Chitinispirillum alkaliphilum]|nr:hypothetical protein CHISP_0293 [Chitinispirillum alkaliphilum]